jgi:hypothetical protein
MGKTSNHRQVFQPKYCWVGEQQKVCYDTQQLAAMSARLIEYEQGLKPLSLSVYKCDYGDHWHLASQKSKKGRRSNKPRT